MRLIWWIKTCGGGAVVFGAFTYKEACRKARLQFGEAEILRIHKE